MRRQARAELYSVAARPEALVNREKLSDRLMVRIGAYAWSVIGLALAIALFGFVFVRLGILTIPLVLALFPAAILIPVVNWLERQGWRRGLAATVALITTLLVGIAIVAFAVNAIQQQIPELIESVQQGWERLVEAVEEGLFGLLPPIEMEEVLAQVMTWAQDELAGDLLAALVATVEGLAALAFGLVALFFYIRDGNRIGDWIRDLFPPDIRHHVEEIGARTWKTLGGYIRGQSLVALVDAVFIGIGLVILGVPLAFVLSVLIFFGGYVPIVGAFVTGFLAVLVALASEGLVIALLTLGVVVAVQQLESNLLAPMVLGRSTALHPLAVLIALTVGAIVYGIIGAIIAVPFAAAIARTGTYLREIKAAPPADDEVDEVDDAVRETAEA
jgi:putative heme transporter